MTETKTYRGRTLEEVLPKIRAELGPEALVLARREGLAGGFGGFFQRSYVEVEARAAVSEPRVDVRSDRATAEGLASPGMQALLAQAAPFADELAAAQRSAGLYGPQPAVAVAEPELEPEFEPEAEAPAVVATTGPIAQLLPAEPAPAVAVPAPAQAAALRDALEATGVLRALAADVVDEAVRHGLPFASPRSLKSLTRNALAARIGTLGPLGSGPRTVVIVGPRGSGKTTAAARLAAAYRSAGTPVRELGVGDPSADDAFDGLTVLDAPATGVRDGARVREIARTLRGMDAEVHLALPATMSVPAAAQLAAALAPLKPTHVLLTHADETTHPGAAVAFAVAARRPLSYVSGAETLAPADAADLARRLCP
jgi:flagellar biosynthesis GTPase FlhF